MFVINLFGVPGAGKSVGASYIFSILKMKGVNVELITEFAKDIVYEERDIALKNQSYIFGEQSYRISRCLNKVDAVITDSPLPLSIIYKNDPTLTENFDKSVMDVFNYYTNLNYLLLRTQPYSQNGRFQTEEESNALLEPIKNLLIENNIKYKELPGNIDSYIKIINDVMSIIGIRG